MLGGLQALAAAVALMAMDWTPEELAELTCRFPACTLLIGLNNHFCDHHAEQIRKLRARRPRRRAMAPPPRKEACH